MHLYNAVGLKKGWRGVVGPQCGGYGMEGDGEEEGNWDRWKPPRRWTAWPMRAGEVPEDGLMPVVRDVNERFTLRRGGGGRQFAGGNLEEGISGTILRYAREKFRRRGLEGKKEEEGKGEEVVQSIEKSGDETDVTSEAGVVSTRGAETDGPPAATSRRKRKQRAESPTFAPVMSADDELSYSLLRPAARRIMVQLDDTLMILHNSRVAGLGNMSESSASDEETDAEAVVKKPESASASPARKSRGGRPRKVHTPLEGETEHEMRVRIARAGKRKIPSRSTGPSGEETESRRSRSRSRSRARSKSRGRRSAPSSRESSVSAGSRGSSVSSEVLREYKLGRWGLRNWRDVLGAAALAGFPPDVLARATQRCATLFKEEMTLHTLHEQPPTSDKTGIETARYVPGGSLPPSSDDDDDTEDELFQLRTVSRQSSVKLRSSPEPETETPTSRRSRSGTPAPAHLCSYPNCPRAITGFTRQRNLARHLQLVHHQTPGRLTDDEEDSIDEMEGGVHVDRFLRPIKVRKGWRAEDKRARPPRSRRRGREGSEELDSFLMRDDD